MRVPRPPPTPPGAGMGAVCSRSVLREGDHRADPARRGPRRPRVVRRGSAAGLPAGSRDHVPRGQRVQLLLLRGPVQHQMSMRTRHAPFDSETETVE